MHIRYAADEMVQSQGRHTRAPFVFQRMFVVVNHVSIAEASRGRYEMDVREHAKQYLVDQPGFRQLELLDPETDSDYLLLAYWDSKTAFEQWVGTDDFEAAHDELFEAMFLDPEHVDQYESATTVEAP